jgi:hypothetical protein
LSPHLTWRPWGRLVRLYGGVAPDLIRELQYMYSLGSLPSSDNETRCYNIVSTTGRVIAVELGHLKMNINEILPQFVRYRPSHTVHKMEGKSKVVPLQA